MPVMPGKDIDFNGAPLYHSSGNLAPDAYRGRNLIAMTTFQALVVEESEDAFVRSLRSRSTENLPAGDVLIRVLYSSLNYKDALSATGRPGVTRKYPHTPGIDAAGIVEASDVDEIEIGDAVIVTGYDLGSNTDGGFGQYIRVPADWVVKLPSGLTLRESMIYGTAGYTAGLSLDKLLRHGLEPEDGDLLVTGATGGVGSMAVALLSKLGFKVVAATGKNDRHDFLLDLGAAQVISRTEVTQGSRRPLLHGRWAGVIDSVGGEMLDAAIKALRPGGAVAVCGNVASPELNTTIYPFILRGATLYGIDSAHTEMDRRKRIWQRLSDEWRPDSLDSMATERGLPDLSLEIDRILEGQQVGRVLVNLQS
jgi:putative YhdH/YhfP family quinone oxidoreductase